MRLFNKKARRQSRSFSGQVMHMILTDVQMDSAAPKNAFPVLFGINGSNWMN